ncbi:MAG: transglycosylase SLT domain-containing protein [Patescibacteria group bacterium]
MKTKTKRIFLALALSIILLAPLISFAETIKPPVVNIDIPTLTLKPVEIVPGQPIVIPWLVEYIIAIYRYGLIIAAVFSVIAFMISGLLYLTAGGIPSNITKAKKISFSALTGVILIIFSYLILYTVNPNLVELKPLIIDTMKADVLENYVNTNPGSSGFPKNPKALADTTFDSTFQNFAACLPTDWRILKVMAYKESALDPNVVNSSGFIGLFQTKPEFCESTLAKYPNLKAKCNNLADPEVNTAVGAMMLKESISDIRKACPLPQATPRMQLALIYVGHNSGGYAMRTIMKKGCTEAQLGPALDNFWKTYKGGKHADLNTNNKKWIYPLSVADLMLAQGVQSMDGTGGGSCPLK